MKLREQINPKHPVIGKDYQKLSDADILQIGDETACVSCLLNLNASYNEWQPIDSDFIGKVVFAYYMESGDVDASERIFRRKR